VNCPTVAIIVENWVGSAVALIRIALIGKGEEICDCCGERDRTDDSPCCSEGDVVRSAVGEVCLPVKTGGTCFFY
jgi:hypothetical protein